MSRRMLVLFLFGVSSCFAAKVKVTNVIPSLKLYIFDEKYVVQARYLMPKLKKGMDFELDIDKFYAEDKWQQPVGDEYFKNIFDTVPVAIYDSRDIDFHPKSNSYKSTYKIVFKSIGVINAKPINLSDFTTYVNNLSGDEVVEREIYTANKKGLLGKQITSLCEFYKDEGRHFTLTDLIGDYKRVAPGYKHLISVITDKNDEARLVGVINQSVRRKVFVIDRINGLARIGYSD